MSPLVYIVVLNWNGCRDTLRCIASLERQHGANFRILVIDNGSADESVSVLRGLGDRIELIENAENLGYTGGNNRAMREAFARGADYVWLFNNDAVTEPDALGKMVALCEADPGIGLVSPLVRDEDNHQTVQSACALFDLTTPSYAPTNEVGLAAEWQVKYPDRIGLVGAAMLVRRSVYEKIGGLDNLFFAYGEDYDYSIRSARAGFHNKVVFEAAVFHPGKAVIASADAAKPYYYYFMSRNEILMWRKHCTPSLFRRFLVWVVRQRLVLIDGVPNNVAAVDAVLAGLWHGVRGVGGGYDPARRMPLVLRTLIRRNPRLWVRVIDAVT